MSVIGGEMSERADFKRPLVLARILVTRQIRSNTASREKHVDQFEGSGLFHVMECWNWHGWLELFENGCQKEVVTKGICP